MMFSRNHPVIPTELQPRLAGLTLMCAGSGLGSAICELAARTGFARFIVADGDTVSESNLNRQSFDRGDLGRNKAEALRDRLLRLNPAAGIEVIPRFLGEADLREWIPRADVVVNTIDFDNENFQTCSDLCRSLGKLELFPTNLAFGGSVVCLAPGDPQLRDRFGTRDHRELKRRILDFLIIGEGGRSAPAYLREIYAGYLANPPPHDPQLGISTWITASLAVTVLVRHALGQPLKRFPDFYHADFNS